VKQHIESFDFFLNCELKTILQANNEVRSDADPKWFLRYTNITVGHPTVFEDMSEKRIYPHEARLRDLSYSAPVLVDVRYLRGNNIVVARNVQIGRIPIMLRSSRCYLRGKSEGELEAMQVRGVQCTGRGNVESAAAVAVYQ